jgi:hypothetical protein
MLMLTVVMLAVILAECRDTTMTVGITIFSITTLSIMTLNITTFNVRTKKMVSIMILRIATLITNADCH